MTTRQAKPVTMTSSAGTSITCAQTLRRTEASQRTPRARRKAPASEESCVAEAFDAKCIAQLYRIAEIRYRYLPPGETHARDLTFSTAKIQHSERLFQALRGLYGDRSVEFFGVVAIGTRLEPLGHCIVGQGDTNFAVVSLSEIARFVVLSGAASFVLFHNHPGGSLEWSDEDLVTTKRVAGTGRAVGVKLVDHILLAAGGYKSMLDTNPNALKADD